MAPASTLLAALVMGVLGSAHCAGMCGGIACAVTVGPGAGGRARSPLGVALDVLAYNAGRIASYAVAGAIAGAAGAAVGGASGAPAASARLVTALVAGAFLVLLGLHLGGWARVLAPLERLGTGLWRRAQPLLRPLLPARDRWRVAALGAVWGWIPCGLVYSALVLAALVADPMRGAAQMLVFGLGTLPVVAGIGLAGSWLGRLGTRSWVRRGAGALMIAVGAGTLAAPVVGAGHPAPAAHRAAGAR